MWAFLIVFFAVAVVMVPFGIIGKLIEVFTA
jgi:hypothetical protein